MKTDKKKHKIVLIDDSLTECKKISQMLVADGFNVTYFDNVFMAMEYIVREMPEIVISDLIMPDMDGYQVCKFMKNNPRIAHIPVLILTSMTTTDAFIKGFEAGAFDFVRKDEDPKVLTTRLRACIEYHRILSESKKTNEILEKALDKSTQLLIKSERQCVFAQFIQGIIHNLKNPLGAISSFTDINRHYLETLAKNNDDPSIENLNQNNEKISQAVDNIFVIINSLLQKGKDSISEDPQTINVNDFIKNELSFFESNNLFIGSVKKTIHPTEKELLVNIVPTVLSQIFQNLLMNALDALHNIPQPAIDIYIGQEGKDFWLEVVDNGIGIEPDHLPQLFEPFFSTKSLANTPSESRSGSGLGLFICKEMIEQLNGKIEVVSTPKVGASFKVILPVNRF